MRSNGRPETSAAFPTVCLRKRLADWVANRPASTDLLVAGPARSKRNPLSIALTVTSSDGSVSSGTLEIRPVVPIVFCGEDLECAFPAAVVLRLRNSIQTTETVSYAPIDIGPDTDQVFLLLFGTGLRFRRSLANVSLQIPPGYLTGGPLDIPVDYAGPSNEFPGLDQVNVKLPRSLAGSGLVGLSILVDGETAIYTWLKFK